MLLLTSTSDKLQLVTGASGASVDVHCSYVDNASGTITPGRLNVVNISTATTTDIVASPGASTQRNVKGIYITNTSGTTQTQVTVVHTDGTNVADLFGVLLMPGENIVYGEDGEWKHHDPQGAEYTSSMPNDYLYATGITGTIAETIPRILCTEANLSALTSGTLNLVAIYLKAGQQINNISFFAATTGSGTPTNGFFALYDINRNLLAQTANFTSEAWVANTIKTKALTATYTVPSTGLYYVGIMITATTVPTLKGMTAKTSGTLSGVAPILHGNSTTGLTTSLPNPAASISSSVNPTWAAVS